MAEHEYKMCFIGFYFHNSAVLSVLSQFTIALTLPDTWSTGSLTSLFFSVLAHHVTLSPLMSWGVRRAWCVQCRCHSVATFQAAPANWQGHMTDPQRSSGWKPFLCTKLLSLGADDSMWHDRWITVQGTAGCCAPQACWDLKSLEVRADWTSLAVFFFFPELCLPCCCPQCDDRGCWMLKNKKVKTEPDMVLLGVGTVGLHHFCVPSQPISDKHESTGSATAY